MKKSLHSLSLVIGSTLLLALLWESIPLIKQIDHAILDPIVGNLLDWNINLGMILFVAVISAFLTLVRKYSMDHETLREIKEEQKTLKNEMKRFKNNPEKLLRFQKKQLEFIPKTMDITLKPAVYTTIPLILMFRWFKDYFTTNPAKVFGMSWIVSYILFSMIFMFVFRKVFRTPQ